MGRAQRLLRSAACRCPSLQRSALLQEWDEAAAQRSRLRGRF
jgi:hypothetical protein